MILRHRLNIFSVAALGFLLGCGIAEFLPWIQVWSMFVVGLAACLVLVWPRTIPRLIAIFTLALVLGIMRWDGAFHAWNTAPQTGVVLGIHGFIESPMQQSGQFERSIMHITALDQDGSPLHLNGQLRVVALFPPGTSLHYGDAITVQAKLEHLPRFGSFDGLRYWRVRGAQVQMHVKQFSVVGHDQGWWLQGALFGLRERVELRVHQALPGVEGVTMLGLLFGDQNGLPAELAAQFRLLGISHLMAVSGYNLTIIALWPLVFTGLLPKRLTIICSAVFILLFVLFTGAPSSIIRAAVMAWIVLVGKMIGRPPHALLLIFVTAAGMAALNPFVVKDDAGFGLSFLAFFGIVELAPLISKHLRLIRQSGVRTLFAETLGAQMAALPYLLGVFGQFAIAAPIINSIILPTIPVVMIFGSIFVMLALIPSIFFIKLLSLWYFPIHALLVFIHFCASVPYAGLPWPKGGYFPWYFGLVVALWWMRFNFLKTRGTTPKIRQSP